MARMYKGTEVKFSINLTAQGFSMDDDDFEIEVASPRVSLKGYKTPSQGASTDVIIFKEDTDSSDSSSSGETGTWYAIVDTSKLNIGEIRVIATAHITDSNAADGVRDEIAVATLGTLYNA